MTNEELERRVAALEVRTREQDQIIAYLYSRSLPNPFSLGANPKASEAIQKLLETLRPIVSGEKQVRSWRIEYGKPIFPELEEP